MTSGESFAADTFEVSADPETVRPSGAFEGANVCRVAMLSTRFSDDGGAVQPLSAEFRQLGFSERVISVERRWRDDNQREPLVDFSVGQDDSVRRDQAWLALNESGAAADAFRFLVAVLGSFFERESAAAAAALWRQLGGADVRLRRRARLWYRLDRLFDLDLDLVNDGAPWLSPLASMGDDTMADEDRPSLVWEPETWQDLVARVGSRLGDPYTDQFLVLLLVRWRLARALRSTDTVTVSLGMAAFGPSGLGDTGSATPSPPQQTTSPQGPVHSTMIHGPWGWKGDWWRPKSTFHDFILRNHRSNLYSRGAKFSWSGALSERQRIQAAGDFCDWADDVTPNGIQTLFGHSYGGEVAARAIINGLRVHELVLLSAPVTAWVDLALPWTDRVVDIRLPFDPVLGLAQTRQRIVGAPPHVTTVPLSQWRFSHGSTHDERVWMAENIARRASL